MKFIITIFEFFFARKFMYKTNILLLKLIIRFIGYNSHGNMKNNGELDFLNEVCKQKPKLCIDIGANIGNYSKYILNNSSSTVIAFEPIQKSFNSLKHLKRKFNNRFYISKIGIGDKKMKKTIYCDKNNLQWANFNPEVNKIDYLKDTKKGIICNIDTLDNFFKKNRRYFNTKIDLIKIDTEGFELEVIKGAQNTINKYKPKYIQIEYNWHHLFKNVNLYYFSKCLKNYDTFKIVSFSKKLIKIDPKKPENNYFNYSNIVFKRKKSF